MKRVLHIPSFSAIFDCQILCQAIQYYRTLNKGTPVQKKKSALRHLDPLLVLIALLMVLGASIMAVRSAFTSPKGETSRVQPETNKTKSGIWTGTGRSFD
jgi:hypothetical protein